MKLREFFYGLGLRPAPREYGWHDIRFEYRGETFDYGIWDHPRSPKTPPPPAAFAAAAQLLSEGDTAIDIGAHCGDTTVPMAVAAGASGRVFAFEPNPYVYKVLAHNAGLNPGRLNIDAYPYAAMETDTETEFSYGDPGFCNGGAVGTSKPWRMSAFFKVRVQGRNIEQLLEREHPQHLMRLKHIKIDTEGYDFAVFRSIRPLVERCRPSLRSEINKFMPLQERKAYISALEALDYEIHHSLPDRFESIVGDRVTPASLAGTQHFDIFAFPK